MPRAGTLSAVVTAAVIAVALGVATSAPAESAAPSASTTGTTRQVRYTVRAGDSFAAIAGRFAITPGALAKANGLRLSSVLYPGRVLVVPVDLPADLPPAFPSILI